MLLTHVVPTNITVSGNPITTLPPDVQTTLARGGIREWEYAYEQRIGGSKKIMVVLKSGVVPSEQQWNILTNAQNGNFAKKLFKTPKYSGSLILEGFTRTQAGPKAVTPGVAAPGVAAPGVAAPGVAKESFIAQPRAHRPVVITPYDAIVSKAVNELRNELKEVDVIKLESTCTGNKAGWVSNSDLLKGKPGKERVIHLCLNDIKNHFKKHFGQPFSITDVGQQQKMKEIIKEYIKVVLEHETEHIDQELSHGGDFGPNPEQGAEKAENWSKLEEMGIMKKEAATAVIARLDSLADRLQKLNLIKEATALDVISNTLESKQAFDFRSWVSKMPGAPNIQSVDQAESIVMDFVKKLGIDKVLNVLKSLAQKAKTMSTEKQSVEAAMAGTGPLALAAAAFFLIWMGGIGKMIHQLEERQKHPETVQTDPSPMQQQHQIVQDLMGHA